MTGIMPLAREFGEKLELEPIPVIEPIGEYPYRCRRKDLWGPEAWAEMEAIWKGQPS